MKYKFKILTDKKYGFKKLFPTPSEKELDEYYSKKYYNLAKEDCRAPQLKRFMRGGKIAKSEQAWYAATLWTDVRDTLSDLLPRTENTLLDIGAGTGFFAHFMKKHGWRVTGIEPSLAAAQKARNNGIDIFPNLEDFLLTNKTRFSAISLLNVLEHVPDPIAVIKSVIPLLKPNGVLIIQVPNDFSPLQKIAQAKIKTKPWWIAIPDHTHYFNWHSLSKLLDSCHLKIVEKLSDFPMEFFILCGDIYVSNPEIGAKCHQKRVKFDLALPPELRRSIYKALANIEVGRNCLAFARNK